MRRKATILDVLRDVQQNAGNPSGQAGSDSRENERSSERSHGRNETPAAEPPERDSEPVEDGYRSRRSRRSGRGGGEGRDAGGSGQEAAPRGSRSGRNRRRQSQESDPVPEPPEPVKASKPVAAQPEPTPEPEAPIVPATAKSFETRKTGDFALWLGTPTRVTRRAALLAGMVVLASLWLAYRIGVSSGRGEYVPPSTEGSGPVADGKQKREPGPGRMQGTLAAHEAETQRGSATTEPSKLLGFSIVTYATSDRSLELADKMRKHLAAQLDGTGAFDEWVTKAGKLIVVVGFPQERFEDQEWQDALFAKIRAFPSPEWDRGFTFSKLDKQLIGGLYRPR